MLHKLLALISLLIIAGCGSQAPRTGVDPEADGRAPVAASDPGTPKVTPCAAIDSGRSQDPTPDDAGTLAASETDSGHAAAALMQDGAGLAIADSGVHADAGTRRLSRVWELGDSITYGVPATTGYRGPLYDWTRTHAPETSFVGTVAVGGWTDALCDGHPGFTIEQIESQVVLKVWGSAVDADLVILMIGTNDLAPPYDGTLVAAHYAALLDALVEVRPDVHLLVTTIPPMVATNPGAANVGDYNARLPAVWDALDKRRPGNPVLRADVHAALSPWSAADFSTDGVHPSAVGYTKIATEFERALAR